jgi:opacity protein-like surface antigen
MKKSLVIFVPCIMFAKIFMISQLDFNAAGTAMRNSDVAIERQYNNIFSNPALLYAENELYFSSSYRNYFSDIYSGCLSVTLPGLYNMPGATAFSLSTINYGKFEDMEAGAEYNPYELMAVVSHGLKFKQTAAGVNLKYIYSKINGKYSSSGMAADLGTYFKAYDNKLGIAAGLYNVGFQIDSYNTKKEDVTAYARGGLSYNVEKLPLTLSAQYDLYFDSTDRIAAGLEFKAKENLTVRAGYDFSTNDREIGTNSKSEKFGGLALGIGLSIKAVNFDASYQINGELDNELSVTISSGVRELLK